MVYSQPTLTITALHSATYTCMAENVHVNGYSNDSSTAFIQVIGEYCRVFVPLLCWRWSWAAIGSPALKILIYLLLFWRPACSYTWKILIAITQYTLREMLWLLTDVLFVVADLAFIRIMPQEILQMGLSLFTVLHHLPPTSFTLLFASTSIRQFSYLNSNCVLWNDTVLAHSESILTVHKFIMSVKLKLAKYRYLRGIIRFFTVTFFTSIQNI